MSLGRIWTSGELPVSMSSAPNNRLREYRQRLGLTQDEAAEALGTIAWDRLHQQIGVDASMISKWERGEKRPRRFYRELLCALYGADEYQLALRPPHPAHSLRVDWPLMVWKSICRSSAVGTTSLAVWSQSPP